MLNRKPSELFNRIAISFAGAGIMVKSISSDVRKIDHEATSSLKKSWKKIILALQSRGRKKNGDGNQLSITILMSMEICKTVYKFLTLFL